jgi:predicted nucleic acid-binding Zn ribbon protein
MKPPGSCPNCGTEVPRNAKACPECGSDENSGWSDFAHTSSLGLPEGEFDYDEFVKEEFGPGQARPRGIRWLWWFTALLLIVLFLLFCLHWY